jgi:uncharacterized repeat protein (TIGR02543 family)
MNKNSTLYTESIRARKSLSYFKKLNIFWYALLLLVVFTASCKKDEYQGEVVGVCPTVLTDPMDKAVDVVLDKTISATFNTAMSASTINDKTFIIKQGATVIPGTIAATTNPAVFTFKPTTALLPFTTYTGTITTGAADTLRTALASDFVWTFTTLPQVTLSSSPVAGGTTTGAGTFAQGSVVSVTATPNTGYTFTNWTDGATVVSISPGYQFTMAGNKALVANFAPVVPGKFAVVLSSSPVAGGTTIGSGSYDPGSSVTVTATTNTGYTFVNWTDNGNIVSTSSSYQFALSSNRTLVANFRVVPATQVALNLSSSPAAGGTTTGAGSFTAGTSVTVSAAANANYTFVNWTDNGVIASTSPSYTFALNANRTLVANFALNIYTLSLSANPAAGGTTSGGGPFNAGTSVTATATANPGYTFVNWTDGGTAVSTNTSYTFVLNANRTLVANFVANSFTLNVTATNGSVVKNPNQATYNSGSTVVLTATPNTGYVFSSWSGDATGSTNPLTVTMNANKNITANFTAVVVPPLPNILGDAALFGAFGGGAGITNQGLNTVINNGSIGTTGASTLITGFHDGTTADIYTETPLNKGNVTGRIYTAPPAPGNATSFAMATKGLADAQAAYISISPASKPGGSDPGAGELGGLTLQPGVYKSAGSTFQITNGDLTLDAKGDPNAVWIFQTAAGLTVGVAGPAGARSVKLINGALAKNVYWYVGSAAVINAAGGGVMTGTIISTAGVTFSTAGNAVQTVLNGRALSLVASVTMVNTTINVPQ